MGRHPLESGGKSRIRIVFRWDGQGGHDDTIWKSEPPRPYLYTFNSLHMEEIARRARTRVTSKLEEFTGKSKRQGPVVKTHRHSRRLSCREQDLPDDRQSAGRTFQQPQDTALKTGTNRIRNVGSNAMNLEQFQTEDRLRHVHRKSRRKFCAGRWTTAIRQSQSSSGRVGNRAAATRRPVRFGLTDGSRRRRQW